MRPGEDGETPAVVVLDAMGVLYRHGNVVTNLLVPYARSKGCTEPPVIIVATYHACTRGELTTAEFWRILALSNACLSHFDADVCGSHKEWLRCVEASPVRVQWDPERTVNLEPLPWRSLQVGLVGVAAHKYVSEWITDLIDITTRVREIHQRAGQSRAVPPRERPYPLSPDIAKRIGASIS